jgi:hypothetical protein
MCQDALHSAACPSQSQNRLEKKERKCHYLSVSVEELEEASL